MNRAEILSIWQCAESAFPAAELAPVITDCLPGSGFSLRLGFDIDIIFDERLHDQTSQKALDNMGLPTRVFATVQAVFAAHQVLIEALRSAAPIMSLDFGRDGHFWIPSEFWHAVSGHMLQRLLAAGGTPETLLALSFERDLGL
jgi:hypothetical protein